MATTYIQRTPSTTGTPTKFTYSVWFKRGTLGAYSIIGAALTSDSSNYKCALYLNSNDKIQFEQYGTGLHFNYETDRKFRDVGAWYHLVVRYDSTDVTAGDRIKMYVNGVDYGYFNGEMSHIHFIDGTAYDASTFGETDATSGIWKIKTSPSVTYGTNGFFLKMEDRTNLDLDSGTNAIAQMAFSIEKVTVAAKTRALKGEYTKELAQDLKAVHGLDAEAELSNILSSEILAEINREVIRTIGHVAQPGAQQGNVTSVGIFDLDTDSNGRWSVEKFKGLMFQIEREANAIAKDTRRGKGNILITSSDTASALAMAGQLSQPDMGNNLNVDDTGATMVGTLNGRFKVYVDPYAPSAATNYFTVGYKGSSAYDAGLFYCPYVPLQMVRAVGENSFQPKIGFKTRYGLVSNPFANDTGSANNGAGSGALTADANRYYRHVIVNNLM